MAAASIYAAYIATASLRSRIYTRRGPILRSCSIDLHQTAASAMRIQENTSCSIRFFSRPALSGCCWQSPTPMAASAC